MSNRLIDIIGDMNTNEDLEYRNKVIPKLFKLFNLITDTLPVGKTLDHNKNDEYTKDMEFVDDLTKDLEDNPHHRASKLELEYCNKLWKKYKNV
tara:strand:- start:1008 stop:1289 length:282 start_codon:yes stop_codon:yes gene_type:complete